MEIKLKKGLKLNLEGAVTDITAIRDVRPTRCAIVPDDYPGLTPKADVKVGDSVKIGTPLLHDKKNPEINLASPVSGHVVEIRRGERRKLLAIVVENDGSADSENFAIPSDAEGVRAVLARSGLLALMRRRPYDIIPSPDDQVRDIFITAFDSAPLAAPMTAGIEGDALKATLEKAVSALALITTGKIYIGRHHGMALPTIKGAEMIDFNGPHPAGCAGIQAAAIAPVNKGEVIWTLDLTTLFRIGRLFTDGCFDPSAIVAVTGPEIKNPSIVRTSIGAPVTEIINGMLAEEKHHRRIISGNVLTGQAVGTSADGDCWLHYPYRQVTVIAEGDDVDEFMGWASLAPGKMSTSRTFPGYFLHRAFRPDARINGGRRAMIMSGQYDDMIPMDIMPEYLIKAIMARDIDAMEKLGIYEVAPEDFAAAEYADTSKLPLQQIVRDGLEYLRKELE